MTRKRRVGIKRLSTGVPGLDQVLGGGLPEYSFNLIAGGHGTGKTTLAHQIMFSLASEESPAIYFTALGETPLKMLRYQQQMSFFDPDKVGGAIRFINFSELALAGELKAVLNATIHEVERVKPALVFVDSFRALARAASTGSADGSELADYLQQLAVYLTSWQATTFLVGEYADAEDLESPVFTVADGILRLKQSVERDSVVRKLQVVKMRGQAHLPGLHTFRITGDGIRVFPRALRIRKPPVKLAVPGRQSTGIAGLDEMMGGGVPTGDAVVTAGPAGSGKTTLVTQYVAEGAKGGEPGVIATFEERPEEYVSRARCLDCDLGDLTRQDLLRVIYLRPLDLSVDETLWEIRDKIEEIGAQRVVIDSVSGLEAALAPSYREDFRESLYQLVAALTDDGITVMMTAELTEAYDELRFTPHGISFLADDLLIQRYVEINGLLRKVMAVVKMRNSQHSKDLRAYEVTESGIEMGETLSEYRGIITGVPVLREEERPRPHPGLTDEESAVLEALIDLQPATAEALTGRTGLSPARLGQILDRLVALSYAFQAQEAGKTVYRPVAVPLR